MKSAVRTGGVRWTRPYGGQGEGGVPEPEWTEKVLETMVRVPYIEEEDRTEIFLRNSPSTGFEPKCWQDCHCKVHIPENNRHCDGRQRDVNPATGHTRTMVHSLGSNPGTGSSNPALR